MLDESGNPARHVESRGALDLLLALRAEFAERAAVPISVLLSQSPPRLAVAAIEPPRSAPQLPAPRALDESRVNNPARGVESYGALDLLLALRAEFAERAAVPISVLLSQPPSQLAVAAIEPPRSAPQLPVLLPVAEVASEVEPTVQAGYEEDDARDLRQLADSGLLDRAWYLRMHPDVAAAGLDPVKHFFYSGWRENRCPNPYFDVRYYAAEAMAGRQADCNPLLHYMRRGERAGYRPALSFNPTWYREQHGLAEEECALAHYLRHADTGAVSPLPEFDVAFYLEHNPDIGAAGIDPFLHFLESGYREGRDPSAAFDVKFYARRYLAGSLDENPLLHFLQRHADPSILTRAPAGETTWSRELKRFSARGPAFETFRPITAALAPRAKVLAFYLPQYHAFSENDNWWGTGFTEWTNIVRGAPRFEDHYQPRVPRDLGFYNLLAPETMQSQIEFARAAGLFGFVFYFYWFKKKRLMEAPVDNYLANKLLDFPFCLMWANENWTRRWDGLDEDVLIAQDYADVDDEDLVRCWLAHFRDPRYIRIAERPVLMIYRPGLIPEARAKIARWRQLLMQFGEQNPVFVMAQGFGDLQPAKFGMDGAIEFPPHKIINGLTNINRELKLLDTEFTGAVFSYDDAVDNSTKELAPDFPLIKTAFPSWDNDARRQGSGMVVHGSTPESYQNWLEQLIAHARHHPFLGERFVCINAWNEWAEGAYLEPDVHFGAAYLNATARAIMAEPAQDGSRQVCLVGHDAHPHGAQLLLQNLATVFARRFGMEVEIIALEGGRLVKTYEEIASTTVIQSDEHLRSVFQRLFRRGFRHAIVNTTAAARAVEHASAAGLRPIMLVHELPSLMAEKNLAPAITRAVDFASSIWFPAEFVAERFVELFPVERTRTAVRPQGSYAQIEFLPAARAQVRAALKVEDGAPFILGVGFADLRKGFDVFLNAWRTSQRRQLGAHFVWVGRIEPGVATYLAAEIEHARASGRFHTIAFTSEVSAYYAAADVFLLTSREDPFPTVVLEALQSGLPVIAFAGSGGIPGLLEQHDVGRVVPMADAEAVVDAAIELQAQWPAAERTRGNRLSRLGHERFSFADYAFALLRAGPYRLLKVSVVVPNYNYAHHLRGRLHSIFNQAYPIFELIVLDDRSVDNSLDVLGEIGRDSGRSFTVVENDVNSGSVFRQWRKAVELAKGDYLWIAEADDESAPEFLPRLAAAVRENEAVVLAYTDSQAIDNHGQELSPNYKFYYDESSPGVFGQDRGFSGPDFIREHICSRNLILNVSSCLWRREALRDAMDAIGDDLFRYRIAGDWLLYVQALSAPDSRVAYIADPLNRHRRHVASVTHRSSSAERHLDEIRRVQATVQLLFPDNEVVAARQRAYLGQVAAQLGATVSEIDGSAAPI